MNEREIIRVITKRYIEILGDNFVGLYVHGSIAFGCFNWAKSDIDFLVVVNKSLLVETKLGLLKVLEELRTDVPVKGLEMSIVLKKYCEEFVYPTPYELHFSNAWLDAYLENPMLLCETHGKADKDLAAHFMVVKNVGLTAGGIPISDVFGDVPKEYYIDSIKCDIKDAKVDIVENPVYIILNLCRVAAYIEDELVLSKEQGGEWGISHLPGEFHELLIAVMNRHKSEKDIELDIGLAKEFCNYMEYRIANV